MLIITSTVIISCNKVIELKSDGTQESAELIEGLFEFGTAGCNPGEAYVKINESYIPESSECIALNIPKEVTIKGNLYMVTTVDAHGFKNLNWIDTVIMPYIITIEQEAFSKCASLTYVSAESLETVSLAAFMESTPLISVNMPQVSSIEKSAFLNCISLYEVTMPLTTCCFADKSQPFPSFDKTPWKPYENKVVNDCSDEFLVYKKDTDNNTATVISYRKDRFPLDGVVEIPTTALNGLDVIAIEDKAFENCELLKSITTPSSITKIGTSSFAGCLNLTSVTMPMVTNIGENAFEGCTAMTSFSTKATTIENNALLSCSALKTADLTKLVTLNNIFIGCNSLEELDIPNVATIRDNYFNGCSKLAKVNMPKIKTIGGSAFKDCKLLSITITNEAVCYKDKESGVYSFSGCQNDPEAEGILTSCKTPPTTSL